LEPAAAPDKTKIKLPLAEQLIFALIMIAMVCSVFTGLRLWSLLNPLQRWYFDAFVSAVDVAIVGFFYLFMRRILKKMPRLATAAVFAVCLAWSVKPLLVAANQHLRFMDADLVAAQYTAAGLPLPEGAPHPLPLPIPGFYMDPPLFPPDPLPMPTGREKTAPHENPQTDPEVINPDGDEPQMDQDNGGQDDQGNDQGNGQGNGQPDPDDPDEDDEMPQQGDVISL